MDTTYAPETIESHWYAHWEQKKYFTPTDQGVPFCMMIPPPNITGTLHMGHAFQQVIMDALTRYKRMQGYRTLWQGGTDHAGIATQMLVERKLLNEDNLSRHDLGRSAFVQKIWEWKKQSGQTITQQMRRLGLSIDWDTERFTMDESLSQAVTTAFVQLHQEGLVYRSKKLINWDSKLQTAISDLEVINEAQPGTLFYFRYPLAKNLKTQDNQTFVVIATTRPETMLGDVALAVHPDDERYQHLIGQFAELPLMNRRIPIIADKYVEPEFGTGCVKITPAHDFNDYEIAKRHNLPLINLLTKQATFLNHAETFNVKGELDTTLTLEIPKNYRGLTCLEARKVVVNDMEADKLLEKTEPHTLNLPLGDRSGSIIEPLLTDQWFIQMPSLAKPAIEAVQTKQIQFVPPQYENLYCAWMNDIQDWCISRQLWWGHRIPAWYDTTGQIYVAHDEASVRKKYNLDPQVTLTQDEDVFDTWFSSALWTFSTLGWPNQTERLEHFHPTQVLVTGFDIIFFWVARMIMMTLHLIKTKNNTPAIPFQTIYIHGLIRDENGKKMSKSKGNVLDPIDMIDGICLDDLIQKRTRNMMQPHLAKKISQQTKKAFPTGITPHGTDALRYTLYSLASTGRDINWDMNRLTGFRNFCNKLWNASRYVMMQTENKPFDFSSERSTKDFSLSDQWIMSRLQRTIKTVCHHMDLFRLDLVSQSIYTFIWNDYCDWYLELTKPILTDAAHQDEPLSTTRYVLIYILESALRLAHPLIPFITEEIWQKIKTMIPSLCDEDSIMVQPYPIANEALINSEAEEEMTWLQAVISAIRIIRKTTQSKHTQPLPLFFKSESILDRNRIQTHHLLLKKISHLEQITRLEKEDNHLSLCTTQLVGTLELIVPLNDLIDTKKELNRLDLEIKKIKKEQDRIKNKLSNSNFIDRAPSDVVKKEQDKWVNYGKAIDQLIDRYQQVEQLNKE